MRNEMQEQEVTDWKERLAAYIPETVAEQQAQTELLQAAAQQDREILYRSNQDAHVTCSGFGMDADLQQVLMVFHRIYGSYSWTGGHADGSTDFLATAVRELKEETGAKKPFPLSGAILSLDVLPVPAHQKHGKPVAAHRHYNVTYGLIVSHREKLRMKPDENSDVRWIPVEELEAYVTEPHMLPIYQKLVLRMRQLRQRQEAVLQKIRQPLLQWYPSHARPLPWRATQEPYAIWVSEIMLQQTRAEAVKPYYQRFLERFPTVQALAQASQDLVNKYWEGLGYYTRAANLRRAAQQVVTQYGGEFPKTWQEIRQLPGVGEYTAGAICSICYQLPTPAVDGNVLRVVARLTDCFCEIDRPAMKAAVTEGLAKLYAKGDCAMLTQSLMELGATVCLPGGKPHCDECPFIELCMGYHNRDVLRLPQRTAKKPRRVEHYTVFLLCCDGAYALRKRQEKGLLQGLWEFPNCPELQSIEDAIRIARQWGAQPSALLRTVEKRHIFTHVEWQMQGVYLRCDKQTEQFVWKTPAEIAAELSLPTAFRQFPLLLEDALESPAQG